MMAQQPPHTQVSPETAIAERCADPKFQILIRRAHPDHWADGERQGKSAPETAEAILRSTCGVTNENHPEFKALVSALERAPIADLQTSDN